MPVPLKNIYLFIISLIVFNYAPAQTINTVAGDGYPFPSGDLIPATTAGIGLPWGIAYANTGDVYFAGSGRIRKVNAAGIISTISGTGLDTSSGIPAITAAGSAYGLARDAAGNFYVSEFSLNRVRKINTAGTINTIAGTGTAGYIGDGGPALSAQLDAPWDIAMDLSGNLYVACKGSVRRINPSGIITTVAGTGVMGYGGDGGPATAAQVAPLGIDVDQYGNLYMADTGHRIRKVNAATGIITTIAGTGAPGFSGDGGLASAAMLSFPYDVAVDGAGSIYISDANNNRIRKINGSGIITTIAGGYTIGFSGDGGPVSAALTNGPQYLVVNESGDIFFADYGNRRVRVITGLNTPPNFLNDTVINIPACSELMSLDTLLKVADADTGQLLHWSILSGPAHGGAAVTYTATSTGSVITPTGTSYSPVMGYVGPDTIRVRVTDGLRSDTITLCFNVQQPPVAVPISGPDTVCKGDTIMLAATTGGAWSGSTGITVAAGSVAGISVGTATVSYIVTNICGSATSTHAVYVKHCLAGVEEVTKRSELLIYPNPADGKFNVYLASAITQDASVTITDAMGRMVRKQILTTNQAITVEIDTPGLYFVRCILPNGDVFCKNLVLR